jgi:hypothetical protein
MFLLFAKRGRNSNTVQSELSPIVQWMEFEPSTLTVLLNQNHFQYCVLPYIFSLILLIIVYCIINFIRCLIVMLIWADNSKIKILSYLMQKEWFILLWLSIPKSYRTKTSDIFFFILNIVFVNICCQVYTF